MELFRNDYLDRFSDFNLVFTPHLEHCTTYRNSQHSQDPMQLKDPGDAESSLASWGVHHLISRMFEYICVPQVLAFRNKTRSYIASFCIGALGLKLELLVLHLYPILS